MKKILLVVAFVTLSTSAMARNLFCHPGTCYLWLFGSQARLEIRNPTTEVLFCQGNVTVRSQSGRTQFRSVFQRILPGQFYNDFIYPFNFQDRFVTGHGFINCREE